MIKYIGASGEAWVVFQLLVMFGAHNDSIADFIAVPQCSSNSEVKFSISCVHNISTGLFVKLQQIFEVDNISTVTVS